MPALRALFAPGYACTPEIWSGLDEGRLPEVEPHHITWPEGTPTVAGVGAHLVRQIEQLSPDLLVGHSMGGVLMLDLLAREQIAPRAAVIVDAFLTDTPPAFFRNLTWTSDPAVSARVEAMLAQQRPRFPELKESLAVWQLEDWPRAALETGAFFVYGGRGAVDREEVLDRLEWPTALREAHAQRVTVVPGTAHFPMLEAPDAFYAALRTIAAAR